jgi:hypothetical protein
VPIAIPESTAITFEGRVPLEELLFSVQMAVLWESFASVILNVSAFDIGVKIRGDLPI